MFLTRILTATRYPSSPEAFGSIAFCSQGRSSSRLTRTLVIGPGGEQHLGTRTGEQDDEHEPHCVAVVDLLHPQHAVHPRHVVLAIVLYTHHSYGMSPS